MQGEDDQGLRRFLTVEDVAEQLHVKPTAVHQYVRDGRLSCLQISPRERRFLPEHLDEFIDATTRQARTPTQLPVDERRKKRLPSPRKSRKMVEGGANLVEELRNLCQ